MAQGFSLLQTTNRTFGAGSTCSSFKVLCLTAAAAHACPLSVDIFEVDHRSAVGIQRNILCGSIASVTISKLCTGKRAIRHLKSLIALRRLDILMCDTIGIARLHGNGCTFRLALNSSSVLGSIYITIGGHATVNIYLSIFQAGCLHSSFSLRNVVRREEFYATGRNKRAPLIQVIKVQRRSTNQHAVCARVNIDFCAGQQRHTLLQRDTTGVNIDGHIAVDWQLKIRGCHINTSNGHIDSSNFYITVGIEYHSVLGSIIVLGYIPRGQIEHNIISGTGANELHTGAINHL